MSTKGLVRIGAFVAVVAAGWAVFGASLGTKHAEGPAAPNHGEARAEALPPALVPPGRDASGGARIPSASRVHAPSGSGDPCLEALAEGGGIQEFVACLSESGELDVALLAVGFTQRWARAGATPGVFVDLLNQVRNLLAPDLTVDLWSRLRGTLRTTEPMRLAVDRYWLYYGPRNYLELDALYAQLEEISFRAHGGVSDPSEFEALVMGLGSAETPEQRKYAKNHLGELLESSFGPDLPKARATAVFSAFRLIDDPVDAADFVASRMWEASRRDVDIVLHRISLELRQKREECPIERFAEPLTTIASLYPDVWQEIEAENDFGRHFTEAELQYLRDL